MTGTQITYYILCKRKLWLFINHLDMEQNNEDVAVSKFIQDFSNNDVLIVL
jgi:CRISPR-associated exonuclease Cas4